MNKPLKITHSKPPTEESLLINLDKEAVYTKNLAYECAEKYKSDGTRVLFKSAIPNTKHGKVLAEIRDNLSRIRICLNKIKNSKK